MTSKYHRRVLTTDESAGKVTPTAVEFAERTSCNFIGPTESDMHGNRYLQVFQDEATCYCAGFPFQNKEADTTKDGLAVWLAGRDADKTHTTDCGGEFEGEYHALLENRGVHHDQRPPEDYGGKV